jgi:uncharacterized Zn-binding protein involved in type VI secretion
MPAARIGDLCAHGGAIVGPGCPTVLIGFMPAVRAMPAMDSAACPMFDALVPHVSGVILKGSNTVLIGMMPAARVSDMIGPPSNCKGNAVAMGCTTVLIGDSGAGGGGAGSGGGGSAGGGTGDDGGAGTEDQAPPDQTYADTPLKSQPPGQSTQNVGTGTHWIEIEMVDEAEQPVVGESYVLRLTDGKERKGALDERGQVRITGIQKPGACAIKFPNLDLAAWERWGPAPAPPPPGANSTAPPTSAQGGPVPQGPTATAGEWRRVLQGECVSSIAKDTGHFWSTIWNHAANAELNGRRGDPNVLLPGDAVFVPGKRPKEDTGNTDMHHKYRRKGEPAQVRLKVLHRGEPLANERYVLEVGGDTKEGITDADGMLVEQIPGNARALKLTIGEQVHDLRLGTVDPIHTVSGVQTRLNNLGFACGAVDGNLGPRTQAALNLFRHSVGLPPSPSGELAPAVLQKLLECYDRMQHRGATAEETDSAPPMEDEGGDDPNRTDDLSDLEIDN